MAETISQYQIAPFTTPQNGQPGDADQVRGNDNTVGTGHNSHDADSGVHFQSSLLANRPAAGTAGRKWYTTDTKRAFYDTGAAWDEFGYLPIAGGTISGALTVTGALSGATSLTLQSTGANSILLATNGSSKWSVDSNGHFVPVGAALRDIGSTASGVRAAYFGTTGAFQVSHTGAAAIICSNSSLTLRSSFASGTVIVDGKLAVEFDVNSVAVLNVISNGLAGPDGVTQLISKNRATGYGAFTGTLNRGSALDTATVTLAQLAGRVMALQTDLTNHGLIGS